MGGQTPEEGEVLERLAFRRHSTRAFLPEPVPDELLDRMFRTAQRTPSWCGTQPWEVLLLSGEANRRFGVALTAYAEGDPPEMFHFDPPEEYTGIYRDRRRATGFALYDSVGVEKSDLEGRRRLLLNNFSAFGAPHIAIITSDSTLGTYGAIDCGAYVNSLTLVAESLGIATVVQASTVMYASFIHDYLGLPENRKLVCGIGFGWEDRENPINGFRTEREDVSNVVTRLQD
jgi:nitroreductase